MIHASRIAGKPKCPPRTRQLVQRHELMSLISTKTAQLFGSQISVLVKHKYRFPRNKMRREHIPCPDIWIITIRMIDDECPDRPIVPLDGGQALVRSIAWEHRLRHLEHILEWLAIFLEGAQEAVTVAKLRTQSSIRCILRHPAPPYEPVEHMEFPGAVVGIFAQTSR